MRLAPIFIFILLLFIKQPVQAQYYSYGQEATKIKWSLIETEHYNVIFPKGADYQGQRVAGLLSNVYSLTGKSLNHEHKIWDVVLHPNSTTGLAYVFPAPRRSEWFMMQSQSASSLGWVENLTLHETRHMVQQSKVETEMPQFLKYILGEHASTLIVGAYLPFWFMEGDATCNESSLSKTGSGRMPDFFKANRAQLVESEAYSFDKSYLGSYKNHIPDFYEMGYLMVGGARYLYDKNVWDSVVLNVAKKPFSLTPFNRGLKKTIGLSKYQLYDSIYAHFQNHWKAVDQAIDPTSFDQVSGDNKFYASYLLGAELSNGKYFARKTTYDELTSFVVIDSLGKEKKAIRTGSTLLESATALDSMVVWSENFPHVRWEFANKAMLRVLNLNTGKRYNIKSRKRYVAPSLSPDKSKILVVEVDEFYKFYLKILDAKNGAERWSYSTDDNSYFLTPSWSTDGEAIYSILLKGDRQSIVQIEIDSKQTDTLLPFAHQYIKSPKQSGDYLYFVGGYSGIDNLYSLNLVTKEIQQKTNVRFALSNPSIVGENLTYSNYTAHGFDLVTTHFDSLLSNVVDLKEHQITYPVAERMTQQEGQLMDFENVKTDHQVQRYSKLKHLFNFHSWGPFALSMSEMKIYPGVSFMSQNLLSTTELMLGYKYESQDKTNAVFANFKYKGLFPIIETNVEYGQQKSNYPLLMGNDTLIKAFDWLEADIDFNINIPLNLSRGKYFNRIQPYVGYSFVNRAHVSDENVDYIAGNTHKAFAKLYMYSILRKNTMDLLANFGVVFDINYSRALNNFSNNEHQFSIENWLYMPGIVNSHGVKIYNGIQTIDQDSYSFGSYVRMARGYTTTYSDKLYTFGADYMLPLFHPDWSVFKFLYFQRFKASIYYDRSYFEVYGTQNGQSEIFSEVYQSTGIELSTDVNFFQLPAPLNLGVRINYLGSKRFTYDFLFGVDVSF